MNRRLSNLQKGLILVLFSSFTLSLQNVLTRIILTEQSVFGIFKIGGFISSTPSNSLLILLLRMFFVVPFMAIFIAPRIYHPFWSDLYHLISQRNYHLILNIITGSVSLFFSQFFIYIAMGNIQTGTAITIFFIYPAITVLLSSIIFKERPALSLILAMITVYIGVFLTVPHHSIREGNILLGTWSSLASGIAFAIYMIMTQICCQRFKFHPVPFTTINFLIILFLCLLFLPFIKYTVQPGMWPALWTGAFVLSLTTLIGYLLNNLGIRTMGASFASIVGTSGPPFTAILARLVINEVFQSGVQILGVCLVTIGISGIYVKNPLKKI